MRKLSQQTRLIILLILSIAAISYALFACGKVYENKVDSLNFKLTSTDIRQDSLLPIEFTCDGSSATLPMEWSGYPETTKWFALIMYTVASPTDIHCYWVLYNIPGLVNSLVKNITGIGMVGNNSLNDKTGYSPPCSEGSGFKYYVYTINALSDSVTFTVPPSAVSMAVLQDAIKNITLSSASLTVKYSRTFQ